jgi:hypothetical protein
MLSWINNFKEIAVEYPLSFLISGGVLLLAVLFHWRIQAGRSMVPAQAGMDPLGKALFSIAPSAESAAIYASVGWLIVCALVDLVFPILPPRSAGSDDFLTRLQVLLNADYVVLAPLLLWFYMSIVQDLQNADGARPSSAKTQHSLYLIIWWITLVCAGAAFQYVTIRTQINSCSSTPPWLWVKTQPTGCGEVLKLNWQGAAHAALRGLDAVMALGLAGTVVVAALRRNTLGGSSVLEKDGDWTSRDGYIGCKLPLRKLSTHLIGAGAVAITIALLHYTTILIHRGDMNDFQLTTAHFAQFIGSSWLIWCLVAFVWGGIAVWLIFRIYIRALDELRREKELAIGNRRATLARPIQEDIEKRLLQASAPRNQRQLDTYWRDYDRINKYYIDNAKPFPLPRWLYFKWLRHSLALGIIGNLVVAFAVQAASSWALWLAIVYFGGWLFHSDAPVACILPCLD